MEVERIGIIAAMPQESHAILRLVKAHTTTLPGSFRGHGFQGSGRMCWLVTSGMGPDRAAKATQALVEGIYPELLVSVGVAGGAEANLQIGDVVISSAYRILENGEPSAPKPLTDLSEEAWQAAAQTLISRGASLYQGTAITTRGAQFVPAGTETLLNPILEMETSGIAGIASEHSLPLLSIRGISDGPESPIPFDLNKVMDEQYNLLFGEILKEVLRHPGWLPGLLRMQGNTRKAADNAAAALLAVLGQPEKVISNRR